MIYVTVGTLRPFTRLIRKMDEIAADLDEDVIMQTADDQYVPKNCSLFFKFCRIDEQYSFINDARIVVAHAGVGTVRTLANLRKRAIFVVRQREYEEVVNDHQIEFARGLERRGVPIKFVYEVNDLKGIITGETDEIPAPPAGDDSQLIEKLRKTVIELSRR